MKDILELVGKSLSIGVVDEQHARALVAEALSEFRKDDALEGVGGGSAKEEVIVVQRSDGGGSGGRGNLGHLVRNGDGVCNGDGDAAGERADDGGDAFDIDELAGGVDGDNVAGAAVL